MSTYKITVTFTDGRPPQSGSCNADQLSDYLLVQEPIWRASNCVDEIQIKQAEEAGK